MVTWLRDVGTTGCPKIDRLARLARRFDVPRGLVVAVGAPAPVQAEELLGEGPVIVRAAWPQEDGDEHSLAGHSPTVHGCQNMDDVAAALQRVGTHSPAGAHALIQRQLEGDVLVVLAERDGGGWFERYVPGPGALDGASTPTRAGTIEEHPERESIEAILATLSHTQWGWDLELIETPAGVRPVQVRPLTRALQPGAAAFLAEAGASLPTEGDYRLDGEHNPAPLSPAHQWLIEALADSRPHTGGLRVIAGWLYTRVLIRDLEPPATEDSQAVFERLRDEHIPAALTRWAERDRQARKVRHCAELPRLVDAAFADFLTMIDAYLAHYAGRRKSRDAPSLARLLPNADFTLPHVWDLSAVNTQVPTKIRVAETNDANGAVGELDDVLFALGLAPLAAVFTQAGTLHGIGADVFLMRGDELQSAPAVTTLEQRRATWARQGALRPPRRLQEGRPVPDRPSGRLSGYGIGDPVTGRLVIRDSLPHLERDPPAGPAIVALPALTAPAARVLAALDPRPLGVCTEFGGQASHAAIMCRELGLSALIGCRGCTELHDAHTVVMQTVTGRLIVERCTSDPTKPGS